MNLNNPIRFRRTITSYPIPHNNNGDRNRKPSEIDAKIDSFLTSTFSNGHGGEERKRTNLQIINSFYSTIKDNSHQQPFVRRKAFHTDNSSYQAIGMKLPQIIENRKQLNDISQKQQRVVNKKWKLCPLIGWIMGGLLLAALITFLVLFITCEIKRNRQHSEQGLNRQGNSQQSPGANEKQCTANEGQNYANGEMNGQGSQQPGVIMKQSYLSQNITPKQLFYKMDHTNYPFVHLRLNDA